MINTTKMLMMNISINNSDAKAQSRIREKGEATSDSECGVRRIELYLPRSAAIVQPSNHLEFQSGSALAYTPTPLSC